MVRFADVSFALRNQAPYTQGEIPLLVGLLDELVARQLKEDTLPRVVVPPKEMELAVLPVGGGSIRFSATTHVFRQGFYDATRWQLVYNTYAISRQTEGQLTAAAGQAVVFVPSACKDEQVVPASLYLCAGAAIFEVWSGGQRLSQTRVELPVTIGSASFDEFGKEVFDGLPFSAEGAVFSDCRYDPVKDMWGHTTGHRLACVDQTATKPAPSWHFLAPGRYAVPWPGGTTVLLDVYAHSITRLTMGPNTLLLPGDSRWVLDPATEILRNTAMGQAVQITPGMRQ
jgi:hypothetical protein